MFWLNWLILERSGGVIGWQISFSSSSSSTVYGVLFCNTGSSIRKHHSQNCHWWRVLSSLRCNFEFYYVFIVFVFLTLSQYLCSTSYFCHSDVLPWHSFGTKGGSGRTDPFVTKLVFFLDTQFLQSITYHSLPAEDEYSSDSCKDLIANV